MKKLIILLTFLLSTQMFVDSFAQKMPLVYNVENTGANYPKPPLPTLNQLPIIQSLPDPFIWADGRGHISSVNDWLGRRAEIKSQIENYEIGPKPNRPDTITASYSGGVLTVNVIVKGKKLTLTAAITLPSGPGPFPAVIGMNSGTGSIPSNIFSSRNIATIAYMHNQVTTYGGPKSSDPYYQLYPNLNADNTGQYSGWAWGVSRIIDGLELVQNVLPIDLKHIAVTGCSYAGKLALFAGAFDERIALTIAQESGGGGATSWRYSHSEPIGSVEDIDNTDYNWFENSMGQFSGDNVWKLPEDHHELMAMVAPRALLVTANPDYLWLSNPSSYVCSRAAGEVWKSLGIQDRFGFSIVGGHSHCAVPNSQIPEISAFVDKFLLGKDTANTNIADTPYNTNLTPWITWTTPALSNSPSLFKWTYLNYPTNLQIGLDTNITFRWNKVKEANKYFIQLSIDPTFTSIDKSDSTTTDTTKTFTGLLKNKKYYWRVQVKSAAVLGPWSDVSSFLTTITLPGIPQIISASSYQVGYVKLKWKKVKNADSYNAQVSDVATFTSNLSSGSSTDTVNTISWFSEDQKYYWRVQAKNMAGSGSWSDVGNFTILYGPTNLVLKNSPLNEITLTWYFNSTFADGTIIERKQSPQTSFSLLDTLKGNGNEYVDKKVEQAQTYTYRIKAYSTFGESDYSNEASLALTDVKKTDIPTVYSISQNYPNPFNPTTKIKFGLPNAGLTKLIIYDLLGREVQTLINKELETGYHEINFDAGNFTSGVYFYRIQSGDFIQTKKMILIK
jgi:hypothetical protein